MHNSLRKRHVLIMALLLAATGGFARDASAKTEDYLIRPGVGIGDAKLGMSSKKLTQTVGKFNASYSLPNGTKVERADWKDKDHVTPVLKVFYGSDGKAFQIATAGSNTATASGISCKKSGWNDIDKEYAHKLKLTEFRGKNGRIDYYDYVETGIAFEFRRLDGDLRRSLYQIIVHKPGTMVVPDLDERSLK